MDMRKIMDMMRGSTPLKLTEEEVRPSLGKTLREYIDSVEEGSVGESSESDQDLHWLIRAATNEFERIVGKTINDQVAQDVCDNPQNYEFNPPIKPRNGEELSAAISDLPNGDVMTNYVTWVLNSSHTDAAKWAPLFGNKYAMHTIYQNSRRKPF